MKKFILASSLAILSVAAQAEAPGYYVGTEMFNSRFEGTSSTGGGIFAGYRIIEGGADVDQVYNFSLLHFASAGLSVNF